MRDLINTIKEKINKHHQLKHSFYKYWNAGKLNKEVLQEYSKQYFHHVEAFPRCISAIHSNCKNLQNRQVLLGNLLEEENIKNSHPDLWLQFANGLDVSVSEIKKCQLYTETKSLIDEFLALAKNSYAAGLGALFAYESQVPEVAASKIKGLAEFYNIADEKIIEFFTVHLEADEWHSAEIADLIKKLDTKEAQQEAVEGAEKLSKLMWNFLSGVERETKHLLN
jgi:pyrroloquinoline-quinone synthase